MLIEESKAMLPKKILILSFLISLASHLLVLSLTGFLNVQGYTARENTFTVDLKEPTSEEAGNSPLGKETTPPGPVPVERCPSPSPAVTSSGEETVNLNSTDTRHAPYIKRLKKKIAHVWTYPMGALARKEEGTTVIRFSLNKSGALAGIATITSSGYRSVDEGAVSAVRSAAPYDPLPERLTKLTIIATFRCRLGD